MINYKKMLPIILVMFFINGCATVDGMKKDLNSVLDSPDNSAQTEEDKRPCIQNFSVSGSFFAGKTFKTYQDFTGISEPEAFKLVSRSLASRGMNITNTDTQLGMITATDGVVFSKSGKTVPLNVVVKRLNDKVVRIECIFSISSGLVTSSDGQRERFCQILDLNLQTKAEVPPAPPVTQSVAQPAPAVKKETTGTHASVWAEQSSQLMTVLQIQQHLSQLGYNPGPADGIMGESTAKALKKFQQDNSLPKSGHADSETVAKLRQKTEGIVNQPSPQRRPTTEKPQKSVPIKASSTTDL